MNKMETVVVYCRAMYDKYVLRLLYDLEEKEFEQTKFKSKNQIQSKTKQSINNTNIMTHEQYDYHHNIHILLYTDNEQCIHRTM